MTRATVSKMALNDFETALKYAEEKIKELQKRRLTFDIFESGTQKIAQLPEVNELLRVMKKDTRLPLVDALRNFTINQPLLLTENHQ